MALADVTWLDEDRPAARHGTMDRPGAAAPHDGAGKRNRRGRPPGRHRSMATGAGFPSRCRCAMNSCGSCSARGTGAGTRVDGRSPAARSPSRSKWLAIRGGSDERGGTQSGLVARLRHLSGLSALLPGHDGRRQRRPQGRAAAHRAYRSAGRRCDLAVAFLQVADGRHGLRRPGLSRGRSDVWDDRGFRLRWLPRRTGTG